MTKQIKKNNKMLTKLPTQMEINNAIWLEAAQIQSKFLKKGIRNFAAFHGVVSYHLPEFDNPDQRKRLGQFWNGRLKSQEINNKLNDVLNAFSND